MTESPDLYDNALAERSNLTLKHEFLLETGFPSFHHATKHALHNYYPLRPHASLDYLTPGKAHELNIPLKKRWKKYPRSTYKERFYVLVA